MKPTPIFGFTYPESGDHTRTWEYWQSLATQVETALAAVRPQNGTVNVVLVAGAGLTAVVFPRPFAAAPIVQATSRNPNAFASVTNVSATGFELNLRRPVPADVTYSAYWSAVAQQP